ncbi:MAG: hypothetical protein AB7F36_12790 [Reyranellaceae bacterium]
MRIFYFFCRTVPASCLAIAFAVLAIQNAAAAHPESADSWPFDYPRMCRETAHVPLVQAAIDPRYIDLWTERQSRQAGRYEQYSYRSRRIDVRAHDEISLFHGLIHRTLDLIGESRLKYASARSDEDVEHWLIYHTLETHWPGEQWRSGREPSRQALRQAEDFWTSHQAEYARISLKASQLAAHSWCAALLSSERTASTPRPAFPMGAVR